MNMPPTLKKAFVNVRVIASILGTLTVLIGAVIAVESRYAHADKTESELQELKVAMDDTGNSLKLDVQQMYLDIKTDMNEDRLENFEEKAQTSEGLSVQEHLRYQRLKEQQQRDLQKLDRLQQFRLEHQM